MNQPNLPPDHLEWVKNNLKITEDGLEDMINYVVSKTGLDYKSASVIIRAYLLELRTTILEKGFFKMYKIGRFNFEAPKFGFNKKKFVIKNKILKYEL